MEELINALADSVPTDSDIYMGPDDLLYCSRCETARQCRIEIFGRVRIVPCLCKCMAEQRDREEADRRMRERIDLYRREAFPEADMARCTFAADDLARADISKAMHAYVDNFPDMLDEGKGLLLYGNVGTGKTFYAACIVNAIVDSGRPCLMTSFPRLVNEMTERWEGRQRYLDNLARYALVAIDDLGVERNTDYMSEHVTNIIDTLYNARVPVVITSNYTPRQLSEDCEIRKRRVYDRLLERCHPIKVDGESRRKEKGRKDYATMRELLGM